MDNETYIVKSHDVRLDGNYADWLRDIKSRYRRSQIKASVKVNSEKLLFNWQLGRDLVMRKAEERWGSGIVEQVSLDLQREFPGEGFSARNIWCMKQWYLFYAGKLHQVGGVFESQKLQQVVAELPLADNQSIMKLQQVAAEIHEETIEGLAFPPIFCFVPWGHHMQIMSKCHSLDEALYYIRRTIDGNWSRNYLLERIKNRDYQNSEKHAVNKLIKSDEDNPTIGLLICSDMNTTEVQWAFEGITTPLGVAAYKNIKEIQRQLPTVEQLQERIKMLEDELRRKAEDRKSYKSE